MSLKALNTWTITIPSYENNIVESINSTIRLFFSDDTSFYFIVDNPTAIKLNADLSKIHLCTSRWLVTFNYSKSESLLLLFQLDRKSLETIYFSFIRPLLEYYVQIIH